MEAKKKKKKKKRKKQDFEVLAKNFHNVLFDEIGQYSTLYKPMHNAGKRKRKKRRYSVNVRAKILNFWIGLVSRYLRRRKFPSILKERIFILEIFALFTKFYHCRNVRLCSFSWVVVLDIEYHFFPFLFFFLFFIILSSFWNVGKFCIFDVNSEA